MRVLRSVADQKDKGQVLVLVALGLLVLVGVVALAVDGGHVYRERRSMQNAADAGALAGAYELCHGDDSNAEDSAKEYAIDKNGAHGAEVTFGGDPPITVTVTVTEAVPTFFARVLGFPEVEIQAEAAAICGRAFTAGLVWPVGYPITSWTATCGQQVILWAEQDPVTCGKEKNETNCCNLYPVNPQNGVFDLDYVDEDGIKREPLDVDPRDWDGEDICRPAHWPGDPRAWLDFSLALSEDVDDPCDNPGGGSKELLWRIRGWNDDLEDCQSFLDMPKCIQNDTGTREPPWRAADIRVGDIAGIPLYDPDKSTGGSDPCELEAGGGARFYVEDLGCIRVLGVYGFTTFNKMLDPKGSPDYRVIVGEIPCVDGERDPACDTLLGDAQPYPIGPGGFGAVSLVQ